MKSLLTAVVVLGTTLGAAAVVAGGTAGATTKAATSGTIEVCKTGNVSGTYKFTIDGGSAFGVSVGSCVGVTVTAANHTVTELADPTGLTTLTAIAVSPASAQVTKSVPNRTVTVKVASGADVTTTFTNRPTAGELKVCKVAGDPSLLGQAFSFTESAGGNVVGPFSVVAGPTSPLNCSSLTSYAAGTKVNVAELATASTHVSSITVTGATGSAGSKVNLANGTVTATVGAGVTLVTYTNVPNVTPQPGTIEVCKSASDEFVHGYFDFTITGSDGSVTTQSVLTGQCTGDIAEPAGPVQITEAEYSPYYLDSVTTIPSAALQSENLNNDTATVTVASGAATTAIFTNDTQTGLVKACKTLSANSGALVGQTFDFNVSSSYGEQTVSVVAGPVGTTSCSIDWTPIPVGTTVTITEDGQANVEVTGVSISPASQNAGSTSTTAVLTVGNGVTAATFTNEALGWVEVCKYLSNQDYSWTANQAFTFSVNGGPSITVQAGQCSQPIQVPAGTATVYETPAANYQLVEVSTVSPTDPTGARLLSGPTTNPATVAVPFGGVGNETVVSFTNAVNQGDFKICTGETSTDANLVGQTASFSYTYTVDGVTYTGTVDLTIPATGDNCSGLYGPINILNADGTPVNVAVTENSVSSTDVEVTSILYQGDGDVLYTTPTPAIPPATICFSLGYGINVATFTNGRTP